MSRPGVMRSPQTLPGHGPSAGQGPAPAHDRALSCQPPKEVTARPQRPTYRKSLVLTPKGEKQKVELQNRQQNYFPKQSPGGSRLGMLRGLLAPPDIDSPLPLSKCANLSIQQLSHKKEKDVGSNNLPAVSQ